MKTNKLFVHIMIGVSVIGLFVLMVVMFIGVKWLLETKEVTQIQSSEVTLEADKRKEVVFNSNILGTIVGIDQQVIEIFDVNKKQYVKATIESTTRVTDAYEKIMPSSTLEVGDVVELIYEPQNDNLVGISIAKEVWEKQDLKKFQIDRSNRTIKIGSRVYAFTDHTLIRNKQGEEVNIHDIGDYDSLTIKGIDKSIYSIQVVKEQGYIKLDGLPLYEGRVEVDTKRHISLSQSLPPIPVSEGAHKVVIQMAGYEPLVQEVEVTEGETLVITAENAEKSYTTLHVQVLNEDLDYQVKVADTTYKKDEPIRVLSGRYLVKIMAKGYKTWSSHMILEDQAVGIQITFVEDGEAEVVVGEQGGQDSGDSQDEEDYSMTLATDPDNAKVYINGEYKGQTPYKTELEVGEYLITFEKEGYQTYKTNILIDNSDDVNTYRYILIPTP